MRDEADMAKRDGQSCPAQSLNRVAPKYTSDEITAEQTFLRD